MAVVWPGLVTSGLGVVAPPFGLHPAGQPHASPGRERTPWTGPHASTATPRSSPSPAAEAAAPFAGSMRGDIRRERRMTAAGTKGYIRYISYIGYTHGEQDHHDPSPRGDAGPARGSPDPGPHERGRHQFRARQHPAREASRALFSLAEGRDGEAAGQRARTRSKP